MKNIYLMIEDENTRKKAKFSSKYSSSIISRTNKISKRRLILSSSKKQRKLVFYPTLNLSKLINQNNPKKITKKKTNKNIPYLMKYFASLQHKKFSKLENLAQSIFQFYFIDEDLTTCQHSLGNIVELSYMGLKKIVFITTFENNDTNSLLFCSRRRDHKFLKFFEETTKLINKKFRENIFIYESKNYDIDNLEINGLSYIQILEELKQSAQIAESDFELLKKLLIIDVPIKILKEMDYESIPKLDLNCRRENLKTNDNKKEIQVESSISSYTANFSKESKILFFSQNFKIEKQRNLLLNSIIINSNSDLSKKSLENCGDVNVIYGIAKSSSEILCKFEATCLTNGVGNLIYKADKYFKPIGINMGTAKNFSSEKVENVYMSFENHSLIRLLQIVLLRFNTEEVVF